MTYDFLQHYWCFIVSLLGAILVFLLFVQGANSVASSLGWTEEGKRLVYNSTGRKWEFTFTTLVTFGGAFFASFPLFYSTSFGGAYWLWMLILFTFVLQAVSYEFQNKLGNFLGPKTFQFFLTLNGILGPLLLAAPLPPSSRVRTSSSRKTTSLMSAPSRPSSVAGPTPLTASTPCSIPGYSYWVLLWCSSPVCWASSTS